MSEDSGEWKDTDKDLNYAMVHADGVIARLEEYDSRLIFYQEYILERTEDGQDIDENVHKRLMFEVRIPKPVFIRLCTNMIRLNKYRSMALNQIRKTDIEKKHANAYKNYEQKFRDLLYDTAHKSLDKTELGYLDSTYGLLVKKLEEQDDDTTNKGEANSNNESS
jgi:hypothetical protein